MRMIVVGLLLHGGAQPRDLRLDFRGAFGQELADLLAGSLECFLDGGHCLFRAVFLVVNGQADQAASGDAAATLLMGIMSIPLRLDALEPAAGRPVAKIITDPGRADALALPCRRHGRRPLGKRMKIPEILMIETVHQPGSLARVLLVIAEAGLTIDHLQALRREQGRTLWEITLEMEGG